MSSRRELAVGMIAAVSMLLGTGASAGADPTFAGSARACTPSTGTAVAVDFSAWGGPAAVACDTAAPENGVALLRDTGFTVTGTRQYGDAFICRLGSPEWGGGVSYPTDQTCQSTPPASAYWSLWHALPGATDWTFSADGAQSDRPVAGEVEAWAFGAGTKPTSFTPDQVRALESPDRPPPGGGPVPAPGPTPTTGSARAVEGLTATLTGQIKPGATTATAYFQYGRTVAYGRRTPSISVPSGGGVLSVAAALRGLTPHTGYHYRLIAGLRAGADRTFATLPVPRAVGLTATAARVTGSHLRFTAAGSVLLPLALSRARACRGAVSLAVRAGRTSVLTTRTSLRRSCAYARVLTLPLPAGRAARGQLSLTAVFTGNAGLAPASSRTVAVRIAPQVRAAAAAAARPSLRRAVAFLLTTRAANGLPGGTSLARNGYYESAPRFADFGLTLDGGLALAAGRSADRVLRRLVGFLRAGRDGSGRTINTWTGIGTSDPSAGSIAKEALLAEVTGYDPRRFAGHDLIAALDSGLCVRASGDGACALPASTFDLALVVIATARAGDTVGASSAAGNLLALEHRDGGWPSQTSGGRRASEVDSTAIAAMALALVPGTPAAPAAVRRAASWIAHRQARDGGFPGAAGISTNSTALAIQALRLTPGNGSRVARALAFLAGRQGRDGGFAIAATGARVSDVRASTQIVNGIVGTSYGRLRDRIA